MGFVSPLALLGLALAAVPIAIHLLRRRDLPNLALPTVALLRRAQRRASRRFRLVDLLLLLARVLLVAALVIGAAGPYVPVVQPFGEAGPGALVIVLDDSASMGRVLPDGGDAWSRAARLARDAVDSLPPGSEVGVILGGARPRVASPLSTSADAARRALVALPDAPDARGDSISEAVRLAQSELAGTALTSQRIVVLSDASASGDDDALEDERVTRPALLPDDAPSTNVALVDARVADGTLRAVVRRTGPSSEPGTVRVEARAGRRVLGRRVATLDGSGTARVSVPLDLVGAAEAPSLEIVVRRENGAPLRDALPGDDERAVLLSPRGLPRLVVVGAGPREDGAPSPASFFGRAIDAAAVPVDYEVVDVETFSATELGTARAVVWFEGQLGDQAARRIQRFVEDGGGLLLWPSGGGAQRGPSNALARVLPGRAGPAVPLSPDVRWVVAPDDPLGLGAAHGLDRVVVRRARSVEGAPAGTHAALLTSDAGDPTPVVVVSPADERGGPVALVGMGLTPADGDLPYRPGFVPLVVRLLHGVGVGATATGPEPVDASASVPIALDRHEASAEVVRPDGTRTRIRRGEPYRSPGPPGAYLVVDGADRPIPGASFVVAIPPRESQLTGPGAPRRTAPSAAESLRGQPPRARKPLGTWFFLFAGVLLGAEAWLRRSARRPA